MRALRSTVIARALAVALGLVLAPIATGCAAAPSEEGRRWWSHIQVLASDSLQGRLTGTRGYMDAARYVAGQLRAFGVKPGGDGVTRGDSIAAYLQRVPFVSRRIRESECSVELVRDGVVTPVTLGEDAVISLGADLAPELEAPLVFVGYGVSVPDAGWNDLAGVDLRGKIAVYIRSGPKALDAALRAHAQSTAVRWAGLRAAGAVGLISVGPPSLREIPWARAAAGRFKPSLSADDSTIDEFAGVRFAMRFNADHFDKLLEGTGHTPAEIFALADSGVRIPGFDLGRSIRARTGFERTTLESPNVVGIIPGTDPRLRDQYVVVSAHLDHLGVGVPVEGDSIYNGAMDNASGTASLIEFARRAQAEKTAFRRSIVLLALTGEEEGLEGSKYFATHPTVPAGAIVADINLDMFLPIMPLKVLTVFGRHESDVGDRFTATAEAAGLIVQDDPQPQKNIFIRSDQYSFVRSGVPSLFLEIGATPGTPEEQKLKDWSRRRYHQPSDDLDQPLDFEAAAGFTRLLFDFTRDVANADEAPRWKPTSFFRRFAAPGSLAAPK